MARSYWKQVLDRGLQVPTDRPLDDLTAELTAMLGSPDPALRDGTAYPALGTWIDRGVYDDLLVGLGDGMAAGLQAGLGESGTDSVFRRSFSVLVLAAVIERDTTAHLLPADQVLRWGDRIVSLAAAGARPARLRARQGLGPRRRPRRRRDRQPRRLAPLRADRAHRAARRARRPDPDVGGPARPPASPTGWPRP